MNGRCRHALFAHPARVERLTNVFCYVSQQSLKEYSKFVASSLKSQAIQVAVNALLFHQAEVVSYLPDRPSGVKLESWV